MSDGTDAATCTGLFAHEALAVVLRVRADQLQVLLWQRARPPFDGRWSLPGGRVEGAERLGGAVARHLAANLELRRLAHLEQLETRSDPARDPRERVLATAYLGLVRTDDDLVLPGDTRWFGVEDLPSMAFDHESIVRTGRERLRAKLSYTTIAVALAPATFTLTQLRSVYSAALGHDVSVTNLHRVLVRRGVIAALGGTVAPSASGGRPARLFGFTGDRVEVTDAFAILRPPA